MSIPHTTINMGMFPGSFYLDPEDYAAEDLTRRELRQATSGLDEDKIDLSTKTLFGCRSRTPVDCLPRAARAVSSVHVR
jgi:hypothetical protein